MQKTMELVQLRGLFIYQIQFVLKLIQLISGQQLSSQDSLLVKLLYLIGVTLQFLYFGTNMSKKRYVKKSQKNTTKSEISLSQSSITLGDFDEGPQILQQQLDFTFDIRKILHLWLVKILPPSKFLNLKFNFDRKKIIGVLNQCEKIIDQCNFHVDLHVMKSIFDMDHQMNKNFQLYLINRFSVKIFSKNIIIGTCNQILKDFKNKQIKNVMQTIQKYQYAYLISVKKEVAEEFTRQFDLNKSKQITRADIESAKKLSLSRVRSMTTFPTQAANSQYMKKKIQLPLKTEEEQQQSDVLQEENSDDGSDQDVANFYTFVDRRSIKPEQNQKPLKADAKKHQKLNNSTIIYSQPKVEEQAKKTKYVQKKYIPAGQNVELTRKAQKMQCILKKEYKTDLMDVNEFKKWIKNNSVLNFDQFTFQVEQEIVRIKLNTNKDSKKKIQAVNIYLLFSKVIKLDIRCPDHRIKVQQKFCQNKQNHLQCKIVEGFSQPDVLEHRLRNLIAERKINKSQKYNKQFVAVWIQGLKPCVQEKVNQIILFIDQLPKQDKIEILILQLGALQDYLYEDPVREFAQNLISQYFSKHYPNLTLNEIICPSSKLTLKIRIKHQDYQQFISKTVKTLGNSIKDLFYVDQITDQMDITKQLKQKYLLYPSIKNKHKYNFISNKQKAPAIIKQIMSIISNSKSQMHAEEVSFKKGRYPLLKKFIDDVKQDNKLQQTLKNVKFTFENQNNIQIFGTNRNIKQISELIIDFLNKLEESVLQKTFVITQQQAQVVQKNSAKFNKQIEGNYKLSFNLSRNIDLGAIITVGPDKYLNRNGPLTILIQKNKNISNLPLQTMICFQSYQDLHYSNEKILLPVKAFFKNQNKQIINVYQDDNKCFTFLYCQGFQNTEQMANSALSKYKYKNNLKLKNFVFFMPKYGKKQFILSLIKVFQKQIKNTTIKIFVLQQSNENIKDSLCMTSIQNNQDIKKVRYYVFDKKNFYYSQTGDQKIYKALNIGKKKAFLTNQDLNLQITTHKCSFKQRKLIHIQSAKQTSLQIYLDKVLFQLNGIMFQMPNKQINKVKSEQKVSEWVDVSIGAYELDFIKNVQINLFSGFQRTLQKQQTIIPKQMENNIFVSYDQKVNEIQIAYEPKEESNAIKACNKLKQMIEAERIKINHEADVKLTENQFQHLKAIGQQNQVTVEWDGNKMLTMSGYQKTNITNLIKNLKFILGDSKLIKYPNYWEQQKQDIQTFTVPKNSPEFAEVQKQFTAAVITQLVRIQNRLVYKKYFDEKNCLSDLNGGKQIKQIKLFHGTRTVDPKQIYQDKQESFNINYTSDNNYLGRGTYFAVTPQYSHNYSYSNPSSARLFGGHGRQMFYCSVLIGDSQNITVVDAKSQGMKDTDYKNTVQKLRYESSTTYTNNSTIYCVYKNRRAYPNYLIRY